MADVIVKRFDELEGYNQQFLYAGKGLGVTAWGMNVLRLPPHWAEYPEHDHKEDGQEEVYVVLEGSATLQAGDESWDLGPGMLARVGSGQKRKIVPGGEGATILALGGTPGKAYMPPSWWNRRT
jgi:mannose-6-phosphate isomerase-like protein (cupin superfamily)